MTSLLDRLDPSHRRIVDLGAKIAADRGYAIWLVGGPVRDLVLGRAVRDLDIVIEAGAGEVAETLATELRAELRRNDRFLTYEVATAETRVDVTTSRRERYPSPGDLPLVEPGPIESDLRRRDLTINAIAIRLSDGAVLDPLGGRADIMSKTLRALHEASFLDDPTRVMRALRLGVRLQFDPEPRTRQWIEGAIAAGALGTISADRFWRETLLALDEDDPAPVFDTFATAGVFSRFLPDLETALATQRLAVARTASSDFPAASPRILYLGALFAERFEALSPAPLGDREKQRIATATRDASTVLDALRTEGSLESRLRAIRTFDAEPLALAATTDPTVRDAVETAMVARTIRLPFTADALGIAPGPHLGAALRDAREAIAAGTLDQADSLAFARERALRYLNDER